MALTLGATIPSMAERVVTTFDADEVTFSFDRKLVTLKGDAHLFSQVAADPSRHVRIEAQLIEGDLTRGRFEMIDDVRIVTPRGTMEGASAFYDARTAQYSIRHAGIMMPMGEDGETWQPDEAGTQKITCGFAYAQEIATEGDIVYMQQGRFTTCSRPRPHYSLEARRFRYNPETGQVVVYGGKLQLYGLEIPMIPKLPYSFGKSDADMPSLWPFPTYTGRDGLRLGWSFNIGDPMGNPRTEVRAMWRQLRPLQLSSRSYYDFDDNIRGRLRLGLREDIREDIDRIVSVDRFPELGLDGDWDLWGGEYELDADLAGGHYRQRREDNVPAVSEDRLRLQARLTGNPEGVYEPGEMWWWVDASGSLYGDGNHYEALGAGLGAAARFTDWFAGNAEFRQWATGGDTPFAWDDIDVKTEVETNVQFRVTDQWRVRVGGRYDLSDRRLRSWDAALRRRAHCLTWKISYSDVSDNFMIGAEVNGLFGNDEPPKDGCPADGPPDYWEYHRASDESGSPPIEDGTAAEQTGTQPDADSVSEAMATP